MKEQRRWDTNLLKESNLAQEDLVLVLESADLLGGLAVLLLGNLGALNGVVDVELKLLNALTNLIHGEKSETGR